jgi:2-polyprenyl-3-methyl-5-hydroxy-6-metoxy-1,4-benzoquinol methylase
MPSTAEQYIGKPIDYFKNPRPEMVQFIPNSVSNILEIGCGNGSFGAYIKKLRPVCYTGVDIFSESLAVAASWLDQAILANIESDDLPFSPGGFDCIVLNDVLEHLVNPWEALDKILSYLAPGGYLVASIPNMRYYPVIKSLLINCQWRYVEEGVMDKTHLRFFTQCSMEDMFSQKGLVKRGLTGINGGRFPWKFGLLNRIFMNKLEDMRYRQFAYVGEKVANNDDRVNATHT